MNRLGWIGSFALSASVSLVLAIETFITSFNSMRVLIALLALLLVHTVRFARVVVIREAVIYFCFLAYMSIQLLWTDDRVLALNTIVPAASFLTVLVLYASLAALHDLAAVMAGAVAGFVAGALGYTAVSGFPFGYPAEFSYNAIAGMYLFGFLVTLLLASIARRRWPLGLVAAIIGAHIVATTSIKTNVGILLGALAAAAVHFGHVSRLVIRNALVILAAGAALAIVVASNESAVAAIQRGSARVGLGIQILQAREDLPGYSAFERRAGWQREGYRGWAANPVFGHGVEAFRSRFGFTAHASHVDVAYNSGIIGLALFYGLFASMFLRLYECRHRNFRDSRLVILVGTVCFLFISFAGTIHYIATLAAFLALGIGILRRA